MAKATKKFTPKKKKTLTPEPNWDKLAKAKTEEDKYAAWLDCDDFCRYELTDREIIHAMRRWIELESGWNLAEESRMIPETYINSFARNGWKARKLGYIPAKVKANLDKYCKPVVLRAQELKDAISPDTVSFDHLEADDPWHPTKVKAWIKKWSDYEKSLDPESKDSKIRMEFQTAHTYVKNMNTYLRSSVWLDSHWGENREHRVLQVCKAMAYEADGMPKRSVGTYYPDMGAIWTKEMQQDAIR